MSFKTQGQPFDFRIDRDLYGSRVGVLKEEPGRRYIDVSPAMYSLMQSDKAAFHDSLKVELPDGSVKIAMKLGIGES